jgi:hypothetical protein
MMLCGALFCERNAVCPASAEENLSPAGAVPSHVAQQGPARTVKQDEFSTTLDRLTESNQKKYLEQLKRMNNDLREQYAALATNYGAYRANYMRVKSDTERGRETPGFIVRNLHDLQARKEKIETRIRELEKKKEGLRSEVLSFYGGTLPEGLSRQWAEAEEAYRNDVDAVYRRIGWWLGIEYSPLWRNNERLFWNNIEDYDRQHQKESDERDTH